MTLNKTVVSWGLRLIISAATLYIVFHNVDFNDIFDRVSKIQPLYIIPLVIITALIWVLRCWRLQTVLTRDNHKPTLKVCFQGRAIEIVGNVFLPFRGGDIVRCYALSKLIPETTMPSQIGAFIAEKVVELASVLILAITFVWYVGVLPFNILGLGVLAIGVLGVFVMTKVNLSFHPIIEGIQKGLNSLKQRHLLQAILGQTLLLRLVEGLMFFCLLKAFSFSVNPIEAMLIFSLVNLGTIVPAAPGFIGTFEFMVVLGLTSLGIAKNDAASFALTAHAWQFLIWLAVGSGALMTIPADMRFNISKGMKADG